MQINPQLIQQLLAERLAASKPQEEEGEPQEGETDGEDESIKIIIPQHHQMQQPMQGPVDPMQAIAMQRMMALQGK